ncbi:MAG: CBS domain-containing protein [Anaerolineales bacterium]|nr:CBS domain-containing protein [Anaerolineales bacterium]
MPYSVEHLIENQGSVVLIQKTDTMTKALDLMIEHDFSQLPVVDESGVLLGMVTYESIMRATRSFNTKVDKLFVRDAIENAPFHYREDDLFDLLDELKVTNAVVIIEPEGFVIGVVTSYDASEFLRNRTEDLMHIEDVEFTIKELIKKTYTDTKGEMNSDNLQAAITRLYEQRNDQSGSKKPKTFEDLTLGDYVNLLMTKDVWNFSAPILNIQKESLYELLEKIRLTRNGLAHFRAEISPRSRDELKYCANWLRSRYQEYEKEQERNFINALLKQHEETEVTPVLKEEAAVYKTSAEKNKKSTEGKTTSRSRYTALANWLAEQKEEQVSLTFEQIEGIIRSPLPDSALQLRAWWANDRVGHYHSILWLEAGWKVNYVNLSEKQVIFTRLKSSKSD